MIKVLFVCLGNICRSPMAEAIFNKMIKDSNLQDFILCDSAATSNYEIGNPIYYKSKEILDEVKIDCDYIYSRQLKDSDIDFDYIVAMDKENILNIKKFFSEQKIKDLRLLLEFAGINKSISDPYYSRDFKTAYKEIYLGCSYLLEYIRKKENL